MAGAQRKLERFVAILAGVEFAAGSAIGVLQPTGVMYADMVAGLGFFAAADDNKLVFHS